MLAYAFYLISFIFYLNIERNIECSYIKHYKNPINLNSLNDDNLNEISAHNLDRKNVKNGASLAEQLQLVGNFIRHHKFNDFDWRRNLNTSTSGSKNVNEDVHGQILKGAYFWFAFPIPELDDEENKVTEKCKISAKSCILEVYNTALEASSVFPTFMEIYPFKSHYERFRYRATAAYYLCWYTMMRDKTLEKFDSECTYLVPSELRGPLSNNWEKFDCAYYSFCPDFCRNWLIRLPSNELRAKWYKANPCQYIERSPCSYNAEDNMSLLDLKRNNLNISCRCNSGYHFSTHLATCIDIDECLDAKNPCYARNYTCLNSVGSYICVCPHGFYNFKDRWCRRNSVDSLEIKNDKLNHMFGLDKIANIQLSN